MDFFKVTTFENAEKVIGDILSQRKVRIEEKPLYDAVGYRVAEDVFSAEDLPDFNRSTVDGYAVKAANAYGASDSVPTLLKNVGQGEMGVMPQLTIRSGEVFYVPTGGAVPKGADAVIMIEHTEIFGDNIAVYKPVAVKENVISVGDDVKTGEKILSKGEKITAENVGVLAALGKYLIKVFSPLTVAIISTGDEIVEVDAKKKQGEIRDTNTVLEKALCEENGLRVVRTARIKDGFELLDSEVTAAREVADIILISGGSSIGSRDFTERVLEKQGEIAVHGIAIKPGKPTLVANLGNTLAVGLPGHPMACLLVLKLLVIGAVERTFCDEDAPFVYARTTINFPSQPGRLTVQPVSLTYGIDGITATPLFYKSGLISVIAKADGYVLIPCDTEGIGKNQSVKAYLL